MTLPTGGYIKYSYSGGSNGITCADGSTATLTREVNDNTGNDSYLELRPFRERHSLDHNYLTDPQGNQAVYDLYFQGDLRNRARHL